MVPRYFLGDNTPIWLPADNDDTPAVVQIFVNLKLAMLGGGRRQHAVTIVDTMLSPLTEATSEAT